MGRRNSINSGIGRASTSTSLGVMDNGTSGDGDVFPVVESEERKVIDSLVEDFKTHINMGETKVQTDPETVLINFMGTNNIYTIFKTSPNIFTTLDDDLRHLTFEDESYDLKDVSICRNIA